MKTALVILVALMLCLPGTVHAADANVLDSIWNYPSRAVNQITSWFIDTPTIPENQQQVLGSNNLVDSQVIETSANVPDLSTKFDSTKESLERLSLGYQQVLGESVLIGLKWEELTVADVTQSIDKQNAIINDSMQNFDWLAKAWGWPKVDSLRVKVNTIKTNLASIRSITSQSGTLTIGYDQLKETAKTIEEVVGEIGEASDSPKQDTLYSKYNQIHALSSDWDILADNINAKISSADDSGLSSLTKQVLDLNAVPNVSQFVSKDPRNKKYDLAAIIEANKMLLALDRGSVVSYAWLGESENKTIVFNMLSVNPSLLARKEVPIKYYLPVELKEDQVHLQDSNLQLKMDDQRRQLYIEGSVVVAANDSRLVIIDFDDIWHFDPAQAMAIRLQTQDLVTALANNPNLGKMLELKAGIETQLTQIEQLQNKPLNPEDRIRLHRQVSMQLEKVNQDLTLMQSLSMNHTSSLGSKFSKWQDAAIGVVGIMFVVLGSSMLFETKSKPTWTKKTKHAPKSFSVFSSNVASSDM